MNVAAGTEIAAFAAEHDGFDFFGVSQLAKKVTQLRIGIEGKRVLAFGTVKADPRHAVVKTPEKVFRLIIFRGHAASLFAS